MARYEADVVIIGGGITAAMVAQRLSELRPGLSIIVVEAGKRLFDAENRFDYRERSLEYGENPWPGDFIADQSARGVISRAMAVGGSALHWGGTCNRFSEEDLRLKSMYGLAVDWPLEWKELERFYCEAERRLGVSGEPSPLPDDWRSEPYPMPAMTMTYNLTQLKGWAEKSGTPFWTHATGQEHRRRLRRPPSLHSLQHLRGLSDRRALLARLDVQAAARAEQDSTARSDARPQARARRSQRPASSPRRRSSEDGTRAGGRVPREDVRRRVRILLERALAAALGQRRAFRTASRTRPTRSAGT